MTGAEPTSPAWQLDLDGVDGWVPLRVDLDADALSSDLRERIPDQDESAIPLLVTLVERARQGADADPVELLAMWARYDDPSQIVPVTVASLRLTGVERDSTPEDFARGLATHWPLRAGMELVPLETASGPAHHLQAMLDTEPGSPFEALRQDVVFWLHADREECLLLSSSTLDLARGAELGRDLAQLALGVRGF